MPRARIYTTAAERQRAFRERRKAELEELRAFRERRTRSRRRDASASPSDTAAAAS